MELQRYEFFFNIFSPAELPLLPFAVRPFTAWRSPFAKSRIFAVFVRFHVTPVAKSGIFAVFVRFHVTPDVKSRIFAVFPDFGGLN
ncbi:MAG: hypothetical protein II841_05625 [Bacteroidales bacterium]|nr:hypothetical protein [Bacteroidales bacterium]